MKHRVAMACAALLAASCFDWDSSGSGCDTSPPPCVNDFECPTDRICEGTCVFAEECTADEDCEEGAICEQRPSDAPQHPFDSPPPGKKVCTCTAGACSGGSLLSSSSASSSSSVATGAGGSATGGIGGVAGNGGMAGVGGGS